MRLPVFVEGRSRRAVSKSTCSHRMSRISPIRRPVTAANRIAATGPGCCSLALSSAAASVTTSDGERTRSRGSSRARSMPRAGFVCCERQSHVLEERKQPRGQGQNAIASHARQRVDHDLNIAAVHVWQSCAARVRAGDTGETAAGSPSPFARSCARSRFSPEHTR